MSGHRVAGGASDWEPLGSSLDVRSYYYCCCCWIGSAVSISFYISIADFETISSPERIDEKRRNEIICGVIIVVTIFYLFKKSFVIPPHC